MGLEIAAIGGVVSAVVNYLLKSKPVQDAAQKTVGMAAEMGGDALVSVGRAAFTRLKTVISDRGEDAKKAGRALANVEEDPADEDYQRKLTAELEKLSSSDAELRKVLEELSGEVQQTAGGTGSQGGVHVSGGGKVYGPAAGTNTGSMSGTYTFGGRDDEK